MGPYLTKLSSGLPPRWWTLDSTLTSQLALTLARSRPATPSALGSIVTELIINAVKYAFPVARSSAAIRVTF